MASDGRRGRRRCGHLGFASRGWWMEEWREVMGWRRSVLASDFEAGGEVCLSRSPLRARTEEELLSYVRKEVEIGRLSSDIGYGLEELYHNYRNAVAQSGVSRADEIILSNMTVAFDRILIDIECPFIFSPHHKAIREPFDYYMFGQNYVRPLIDFRKSYVGNISFFFFEMEQHLRQGHNVILFSNHQTEADPAIIALLLEKTNPHLAEAMGSYRSTLQTIQHGKKSTVCLLQKHMFDDPELVERKRRANTQSLKEMAVLLRNGSQIVWIAPSGGRDRLSGQTGEWLPATFDVSSLDNMRRLAEHSGVTGHFYPLAMLCYDVMPPPPQVEKEIGEQRKLSHHGVGLSVAPELNFYDVCVHCEKPEEAKEAFSIAVYNAVTEQYNILKSAIYEHKGFNASDSNVSLSQPWRRK
ncbi:hypothetical protein HPP92_020506 [Vanilla planifolia]|uniref:Glycerol-3-phosphate acyltransferase, chloroplastic n=1 Tax=Vanilla planifolia TaxID=51239 RepID=A0A835Q0L2_VANPL|nr:hypothetical protein HPP92_020506 [Vanilla planifolia]